jgi:hypothetical protein
VSIAHDEIGVWDIGAVLPPDVPPVDGVLSLRTFAKQPFTLDLSEARLILESEESLAARTAGANRLRSRLATGIDGDELTVLVHAGAPAPGWLLIDSANLDVVQLAPHMSPPGTGDEPWEAELRLDGLPLARAQARTRDILYDGALSESFLRGWTLTFDLRSGAVWAAPARGAIGAAVPDS